MTDTEVVRLTKKLIEQDEHERIERNMELLRRAPLGTLFRLRDAAKIMESCGYVLDPLAESSLFEYAIKQRGGT
jgi:hypothetical protein